jgi:hypothetical protein
MGRFLLVVVVVWDLWFSELKNTDMEIFHKPHNLRDIQAIQHENTRNNEIILPTREILLLADFSHVTFGYAFV